MNKEVKAVVSAWVARYTDIGDWKRFREIMGDELVIALDNLEEVYKGKSSLADERVKLRVLEIARKFREKHEFLVGDSLEALIDRIGGSVAYVTFSDNGLFEFHNNCFEIRVGMFDGVERNRFSIARYLGQYELGKHDEFKNYKYEGELDWMCNLFAGELLMGADDFTKYWSKYRGDLRELSARYMVQDFLVGARAKVLGL